LVYDPEVEAEEAGCELEVVVEPEFAANAVAEAASTIREASRQRDAE
jgi:hypothetical protein